MRGRVVQRAQRGVPGGVVLPVGAGGLAVPAPGIAGAGLLPGGGSWAPNLPAGLTLQIDTTFDGTFPGQFGTHPDGWSIAGDYSQQTSATGASYGPNAMSIDYAGNSLGGGAGGARIYTEGATHRTVYYCVDVWVPSDYVMHSNEEKFIYPRNNLGSPNMLLDFIAPSPDHGAYGVASASAAELADFWVFCCSPQTTTSGWRRFQPANGVYPQKNQWNLIECYARQNTAGSTDGVLRVWVGGTLAWEMTDIRWTESGDGSWSGLYVDGTRGGGNSINLTPAGGQTRQYDRLAYYASTSRV